MIQEKLSGIDCEVFVYEPGQSAISLKKETRLTPARALLIYMLDKWQRQGFDATAFLAVKLVYFLQKFGAGNVFRMKFEPYIYGPYCDKVRHLLHAMDGSFLEGFADMNKKPFEPFGIMQDRMQEVTEMVDGDASLKLAANKTLHFLEGYSDDFYLELMSSVDFLLDADPKATADDIYTRLCGWNERKGKLFADRALTEMAYNHITKASTFLPA